MINLEHTIKQFVETSNRHGLAYTETSIRELIERKTKDYQLEVVLHEITFIMFNNLGYSVQTDGEVAEYRYTSINDKWVHTEIKYSIQGVNEMGLQGWQLVTVIGETAVMKRKAP